MNRLIVLIAILSISAKVGLAQSFAPLTAADRKNYVLSVDQKTVRNSVPVNASIYPHKIFSRVVVKLSNNSNDTLRYLTMSCGWEVNFKTDNSKFAVAGGPCQHNVPTIRAIPPHKDVFFYIDIAYGKGSVAADANLKIGMIIIKSGQGLFDFMPEDNDAKFYAANMIWSNVVIITRH